MLSELLSFLFQVDKILLQLLIVIVGIFIYYKKRDRLLDYALALILTSGISEIIKYYVNKPRPVSDFIFEGSGFPSSHSATAACVVFFYLLVCHASASNITKIGKVLQRNIFSSEMLKCILIVLIGATVAWLRVALKAHDWIDVFAGIILGYFVSLVFMFYDISGRRVK